MGQASQALRNLTKSPVFVAVSVLSLALGIGANTAIFTLVDQVLLRLLPVERPRELVQLRVEGGRYGSNNGDGVHTFSYPLFLAFRERNTVLTDLTGQRVERISMTSGDRHEMATVGMVAGNFFEVFGLRPHLGRLIGPADDRARMAHPVAVLQHGYWRSRFGGRPGVVGEIIRLNGTPFEVIGVAPAGFEGTDLGLPTQAWVPVAMKSAITPNWDDMENERSSWFYLFGRLKPGVTLAQAEAAMRTLYAQRQQEELQGDFFSKFPDLKEGFLRQRFSLIPAARGQSSLEQRMGRPLLMLQWLVGLVLLLACANVANLLLARAANRQRELSIRSALGASRGQLMRQFTWESVILAGAGCLLGLLFSRWMAQALIRLIPIDPGVLSLSPDPDPRVLGFALAMSALAVLLFGIVPAWRAALVNPGVALKESGAVAGGRTHVRMRKALIGVQVALCTLLLIAASLFARSLGNLRGVDLGMETENVVTLSVRPAAVYETGRKAHVFRSLLEKLESTPGVVAVGANTTRLFMGGRWDSSITLPGFQFQGGEYPWSYFNAVTPGYFRALGIPVTAGRDFDWRNWGGSRMQALVNQALVDKYLAGSEVLGRRMGQGRAVEPEIEIIGVFGNARYNDVRGEVPRQTFLYLGAEPILKRVNALNLYVRVAGDPATMIDHIRRTVSAVDNNMVISDLRMLDEQVNFRLINERLVSFLATGFGVLATVLAVVGIYGVLAFLVTRRTREIGIRMALGAGRGRVISLVLREVGLVIGVGLLLGIAGGAAGARLAESLLFGMEALDPAAFLAGATALLSAAVLASLIPAWRAARIQPVRALRDE
jgi:predicted permease